MSKKYYSSLIIVFIGFFLVKSELILDGCFGIIEFFLLVFRWLLIIGVLTFVTIRWALKTERPKYNYLPLITAITVGAISILANWYSDRELNSTDKLTASTNRHSAHRRGEIRLKESGKYFIELPAIEWTCRYSGNFKINDDTLYLDESIILQSDSIFNDQYIFNADKKYLVPITNHILIADSSEWLEVSISL